MMFRRIRTSLFRKLADKTCVRNPFSRLELEWLEDRITPASTWWAGVSTGALFANQAWGSVNSSAGWQDYISGDFNGDGKTDLAMCTASGQWWVGLSSGAGFSWQLWTTWNSTIKWQFVQAADVNGDGKADVIGYVKETGQWWVALSTGFSFTNSLWGTWNPQGNWTNVTAGDFDGDGKADIAGFLPSSGQWWVARSTGSSFQNNLWTTWNYNVSWTHIVMGDFSGDGKEDIAGYESGQWWVSVSTGSSFRTSLWATWNNSVAWGSVAAGDFNGDGKADLIARDPQSGMWWIALAKGAGFQTTAWAPWSTAVTWGDVQVADFNGDGKADITGRVLQSGQWWTGISTGSGFNTASWGAWSTAVTWEGVHAGDFAGNQNADIVGLATTNLYVTTYGSDANPGTSSAPLRNINTALARATPGMTVFVAGGTYYEHVVDNVAGTAVNPITITSYNGTAIIDGSTQGWTPGGDQNLGLVTINAPNVILKNLKIVNSLDTGIVLNADNLTISGNEIDFSQRHAISTNTTRQSNYPGQTGTMIHNISITGNVVYDNVLKGQGYGQAISLIADGFLVNGNLVEYNQTEGIDIWLGATHGQVTGNRSLGNGSAGIYTDGVSYVRIDHNQVNGNKSGIGISSESPYYSSHDIWVYDNVVYSNVQSGLYIWDSDTNPGFLGSQNVLLSNNTLINNATSIYLHGQNNTAQIMNNLAYSTGMNFYNSAVNSTFNVHNNVWIHDLTGFVSAATSNYDLLSSSPAVNAGSAIPSFWDNLGNVFSVTTDYLGRARVTSGAPDAGAYEYP